MGILPVLSLFPALLAVLASIAGWQGAATALAFAGGALALGGLARPGEPVAATKGRQLATFALLLAFLPFLRPVLVEIRRDALERRLTEQAQPAYRNFDSAAVALAPELDAFAAAFGRYPTMTSPGFPPFVDSSGQARDLLPTAYPPLPAHPIEVASRRITTRAPGPRGVLHASVGPDGIAEIPPAQDMAIVDGEPCHPLAPLLWVGADLRQLQHHPSDGALANGDLLAWHSAAGQDRDQDWAAANDAWDRLSAATPGVPDPARDLQLAQQWLAQDAPDHLAALAAASRAIILATTTGQPVDLAAAQRARAEALYHLGHHRRAADAALAAIARDPKDPAAHWWAAASLVRGGRAAASSPHFAAAFQLVGDHPHRPEAIAARQAIALGQAPRLPESASANSSNANASPVEGAVAPGQPEKK